MKHFQKLNTRIGWILWAVATLVYVLTLEPTVSFWDCGEFIASGYKLQVGHPPGAPLFLLLARFFSLFSFGNVELVAHMVNMVSALASSFTILLLFWTITHIARKLVRAYIHEPEEKQNILILAVGILGALTFTFTDTFWFSAVEGEVYALSSLCTAFVFWAILKWEERAVSKTADKWLVLIAYVLGLSIGVHLLNILTLPAIVLMYYYKRYNVTQRGAFLAFVIALFIVGFLMWVFIPGVPAVGAQFDRLFVNTFGFAPNTGFLFYLFLLLVIIIYLILYSHKKKKRLLNIVTLMFGVLLIGYSSYAMIVIRSSANTPMDENNPEQPFSLVSYLNREQYGSSPLVFGNTYNAPVINYKYDKDIIEIVDGTYQKVSSLPEPVYDENFITFFPRMWSKQPHHVKAYKKWAGIIDGENTIPVYAYGRNFNKPSFGQNLKFFFKYQLNHMYFRYFMWNFSGRQNDYQGHGEPHKGNWITGISFVDNVRLGPQDVLPKSFKENRAHNTYFALPFILGLLGLWFLWKKSRKDFTITTVLFFFTGIAIVLYLNQYPFQPRERDYAYVGSFYVFAIWIGFGFLGLYQIIKKYVSKRTIAITILVSALCPVLLAVQNWDDHSRAGRYIARDFSKNYLESCAKNAILFTYGDNDTFPLWYLQDVEGVRTDVRVVNLSLFNTSWYINQMKRRAYNSAPIPSKLPERKYRTGVNDQIFVLAHSKLSHLQYPVQDLIDIIISDNKEYKASQGDGSFIDYIPVPQAFIPVDVPKVFHNNTLQLSDSTFVVNTVPFSIVSRDNRGNIVDSILQKNKLLLLDVLASNNWNRPLYFSTTVSSDNYFDFRNYLYLEGLAYRLQPKLKPANTYSGDKMNMDIMYNNIMHKFSWGNISDESVYIDENIHGMVMNYRNLFSQLAHAYINLNDFEKARLLLEKCDSIFPESRIPYDYFGITLGNAYYGIGDTVKGKEVHMHVMDDVTENFLYFMSVHESDKKIVMDDAIQEIGIATELFQVAQGMKHNKEAYFIAESTSSFIENMFPFAKQITICNPQQFEQYNQWIFNYSQNNRYVAYRYNALKVYLQSN